MKDWKEREEVDASRETKDKNLDKSTMEYLLFNMIFGEDEEKKKDNQ